MSGAPRHRCWRVGFRGDPLGFTPRAICSWSHRFDDLHRRMRTIYLAEHPETSLREVLADFRPNLAALGRFEQLMGSAAGTDVPADPVTAAWRRQHVLAPAQIVLDGATCDLTSASERQAVEIRHADLLHAHGLSHLDLHEVTTRRRIVTQTVAADLYDRGVAAIRFPSRLDGGACLAMFEGRGTVEAAGDPIPLTDPPPPPLERVAAEWRLSLDATIPDDYDDLDWPDSATAEMIAEEPW